MRTILFLLFLKSVRGFISNKPSIQLQPTPSSLRQRQRHGDPLFVGSNANEMMPLRRGSTVALITPFKPDGSIDINGIEKLIDMHLEAQTDNLCVLGTTAEASVMSMNERELVLKTIVNKAKGKIPILVGTGTINPDSVKKYTQQAIDFGADASLLVTPYYVKPPQRGLIKHFTSMADLGLPVIVYNVPGRTAVDLSDETIAIMSQHEAIVGVKDATGDVSRLTSLKKVLSEMGDTNFLKYSGDDATTTDYILEGGDGCISVTANIVPGLMRAMVHAALEGNEEQANELNRRLSLLNKRLFVESNPIPCKWAANRLGIVDNAYCRPPLDVLDPQYYSFLEEALTAANLI
ncbi:dihydrodipicolinate synthase [Nitzschia inconspicua]|uniref:Dihydrodipicolinate synthase n=1 Tax=Nitzschia inconspicua TaxID=303405 RepID=A0A9K3PFP2_9STRA|nr:dihydrodipicolinate synthase [Nitzschia inconspicua]